MAVVVGVGTVVVASLVPVILVWLWLHRHDAVTIGRRLGLLAEPPITPGRPLDAVATDLRRLAQAIDDPPPGTTQTIHVGTLMAYDDALRRACEALGIDEHLADPSRPRDLERQRVERALTSAGLEIRPSRAA